MDMANYKTGQFEKQSRTKISALHDMAFNLGFLAYKHDALTGTQETAYKAAAKFNNALSGLDSILARLSPKTSSFGNELGKLDKHFTTAGFKGLVFGITVGNALTELLYTIIRLPGEILKMGDTFILTQAKMAIATNSTSEALKANDLTYAAAQRSRSEYGEMTANVSKIGVAAKRYFNSTEEMVRFAETVSKSFTVAGATSEMRRNSTLQLIQALGSGKLQGDEFKSISEGAPLLLDALEKYTKIDRGLLKEAGKKGELTSDILKASVIAYSTDIDEAFNKMPTTFEQACTQMANKLTYAFNPVFEEISKSGGSIINGISENIWGIFEVLIAVATIITVTLIPSTMRLAAATWSWAAASWAVILAFMSAHVLLMIFVGIIALLAFHLVQVKDRFVMFFATWAEGFAILRNNVIDMIIKFETWINTAITLINVFRNLKGEAAIKPISFGVSEKDKVNPNEKKFDAYLWAGNLWDKTVQLKKRMQDMGSWLDVDKMGLGAGGPGGPGGDVPVNVKGGKLDSVKIYEEDLVLLKDLAMREYQLNYSQVSPQMTLHFGDVHKEADVDGIVKRVNREFIEAIKTNLRGGVIVD